MLNPKRRALLQTGGGAAASLSLAMIGTQIAQATGEGAAESSKDSAPGILGLPAPELNVDLWTDADDAPTRFSIAESRGKWVFLKCFQYWCPGCHSSGFPTLQKVQRAFAGHPDVAIAALQTVFEGFTTNHEERLAEIRQRYKLTIPIGHDAGDPVGDPIPGSMRAYRTGGTPWLVLIDPQGTVIFNAYHVDAEKLIDYLGSQLA